jgi:tRNA G18 (ribose-2'-O)-methylase SpoU
MRKRKNSELGRKSVREFKASGKMPLILVLDNVRSLNNIGSVFRTADAFLVEAIYLCGITAQPPHRDIQKTALGATESVAWEYVKETERVIDTLKKRGIKVISVEQVEGSISLRDFRLEGGCTYALVFGHEIHGVQQSVVDMSDACIEIPQLGTKHSFNIAVSAGIVLWEFYCQLEETKKRAIQD